MNIVHLIDYFQPKIGYQETFLAKEHAKLGHHVTVVTSDRYYPFPEYEKTFSHILGPRYVGIGKRSEEGISVIRLPSWEIPGSPLVYVRGLGHVIDDLSADVVLCHGVYSLTSFRIAQIHRGKAWKLFYDSHAALFNTPLKNTLAKQIYFSLYQKCMRPLVESEMKGLFAIGDDEKDFLRNNLHFSDINIPIIRLGVDINRFCKSAEKRKVVRKRFGIPDDACVVVNAGKMGKEKDIPILLRAVEMLDDPTVWLLLIGDGAEEVTNQISDHIKKHARTIHIPYVPNEDLPTYFSGSDVGVWPGNFTMTILEAMSCSLPVILADQSSTAYLHVCDGVQWFVRGDSRHVANVLKQLCLSSPKRQVYGRSCRAYVDEYLSWVRIAADTTHFFTHEISQR